MKKLDNIRYHFVLLLLIFRKQKIVITHIYKNVLPVRSDSSDKGVGWGTGGSRLKSL